MWSAFFLYLFIKPIAEKTSKNSEAITPDEILDHKERRSKYADILRENHALIVEAVRSGIVDLDILKEALAESHYLAGCEKIDLSSIDDKKTALFLARYCSDQDAGTFFQSGSEQQRNDFKLAHIAVTKDPKAAQYLGESLYTDNRIIHALLKHREGYKYVPDGALDSVTNCVMLMAIDPQRVMREFREEHSDSILLLNRIRDFIQRNKHVLPIHQIANKALITALGKDWKQLIANETEAKSENSKWAQPSKADKPADTRIKENEIRTKQDAIRYLREGGYLRYPLPPRWGEEMKLNHATRLLEDKEVFLVHLQERSLRLGSGNNLIWFKGIPENLRDDEEVFLEWINCGHTHSIPRDWQLAHPQLMLRLAKQHHRRYNNVFHEDLLVSTDFVVQAIERGLRFEDPDRDLGNNGSKKWDEVKRRVAGKDRKFHMETVRQCGQNIELVPKKKRNREMIEIAVREDVEALKYLEFDEIDSDLLLIALQIDIEALRHVEYEISVETALKLYAEIVPQNPDVLKHTRPNFRKREEIDEFLIEAIGENPEVAKYTAYLAKDKRAIFDAYIRSIIAHS